MVRVKVYGERAVLAEVLVDDVDAGISAAGDLFDVCRKYKNHVTTITITTDGEEYDPADDETNECQWHLVEP